MTTLLVTSRSFSTGRRQLTEELAADNITVIAGPSDHGLAALTPLLADADAWIAGTGPVTEAHLALAPHLRIIARYGVGVDAVDLQAARRRGIAVTNTPGANSGAVADHTIALLLAALRQVTAGDRRVRSGSWTVQRTHELSALTVGIVGFGRIGRGVAARLAGFGCRILAHDPYICDAEILAAGATSATMDQLVADSEVITLHSPGDQLIVDGRWLESTREALVLVNTARANLIDEDAVATALRTGRLSAYAADSLNTESGQGISVLLADDLADLVTVTPHSAAQTVEAVDLMGIGAVDAVRSVLGGLVPANLVTAR